MNRSTTVLLSFAIAVVGATLDYLVQELSNRNYSLGVLVGVGGAVAVAAILDAIRELRPGHVTTPGGGIRYTPGFDLTFFKEFHRGLDAFRLGTVITSAFIGAFSWIAAYVVILATITIRYSFVLDGAGLGKSSHYDQSAVVFISDFQGSAAIFWFALACVFLAMLTKPPSLVPLTVLAVSLANAATVPLKRLTHGSVGPRTQFMQFISVPDARFFRIPDNLLLWGCLGAFVASFLICGLIHAILAATSPRRRQQ